MPPKGNQGRGHKTDGKTHPDNHGADVSAIARETPRGKDSQHGQIVSDAAHAPDDAALDPAPASDQQGRS